ncbi:MAG: MlaD family protein [Gammaproteobacteria bacterium]
MRRDNINYLAVGIFVLAVGAAFLWIMYRLTGSTGPADRYYAVYNTVNGIKYGTVTYYKGYPVGQVEQIDPLFGENSTRYRVEFSVKKDWKIRQGSAAAIVLPGPLAPAVIDIHEGTGTGTLAPGSELASVEQGDVFAMLNDAAADFKKLTQDSKPLLKNLTTLSEQLSSLTESDIKPLLTSIRGKVDDPELFNGLKAIVKKLDASADALSQTLNQENRDNFAAILVNAKQGTVRLDELIARIESSRQEMHNLLVQMNALVKDNRDGVAQTINDASGTMRELRSSVKVVADNVDTIVHYLEGSGRNMQEFSREVRENPGVLLGGKTTPDPLPAAAGENK